MIEVCWNEHGSCKLCGMSESFSCPLNVSLSQNFFDAFINQRDDD